MFDFNCKTAFLFSKTFSYRYSLKQNLGNVKQSRAQLFCGCLHSPKSLSAVFAKTHAKPLALFEVCCGSQLSWWWPSRDLWNYMWAIMAERVVGRDTIRNRRGTGKTNILQREGYSLTSEDYHSPNATKTLVKSVELLFLFVLAWGRWITPVMPSTWCPLLSSALVWELLYISSALAWNKSLSPMSNTICKTLVASKLWLPYQGWAKVWGWEKLSLSQGDTHKTGELDLMDSKEHFSTFQKTAFQASDTNLRVINRYFMQNAVENPKWNEGRVFAHTLTILGLWD